MISLHDETGGLTTPARLAERSGLSHYDVEAALRALAREQPVLFETQGATTLGRFLKVGNPTGRARRICGAWPTPEQVTQKLLSVIRDAADTEADAQLQAALRLVSAYFHGPGRCRAAAIGAAAIAWDREW